MKPGIEQRFSLSRARVNRGYSATALAAELKIDQRTLKRLEAGKRVHPAKALVVAEFFGVEVTDLVVVEGAAA